MGKIVAIGGGDAMAGQTREIDECIVRMAHKERPKFLFLPTASEDAEPYIVFINAYFCGMGCETSTLRLISEKPRGIGI